MELRPPTTEETEDFDRALSWAFHREITDADRELFAGLDEPERMLACFDDGRVVATTMALSFALTVPGAAAVRCAGVTAVAVVPTHRRRGLLTELMRRQLDDVRERGEPVAALWSSEGPIYRRFGYGMAAHDARLAATRPRARVAQAPPPGSLRADLAGALLEPMRAIHERVRLIRPGMIDRPGRWWDHRLHDPPDDRDGAQALRAVLAGDDGYAIYTVKRGHDDDGPAGEVLVRELVATTAQARAALWAFLLDQDLTRRVRWDFAPVDEPLRHMVTDPYAVTMAVEEALWVRMVDVEAALGARSYVGDPDVVLEVADAFCPWVAGRYRVAGGACARTDAPADLALDASTLGAAYLGGVTLAELAAAGRVQELRPGALERASRAFRGDVAPWVPEIF